MEKNEVRTKIIKVLEEEVLENKIPDNFKDDDFLGEKGLGLDSMNFLKLLTDLETALSITIEDDFWDYEKMFSINALVEYFSTRNGE